MNEDTLNEGIKNDLRVKRGETLDRWKTAASEKETGRGAAKKKASAKKPIEYAKKWPPHLLQKYDPDYRPKKD